MRTFDVEIEFTARKTYRINAQDEMTAKQLAKAKASDVEETFQDSDNMTSIESCEEVFTLPDKLDFMGGMITFIKDNVLCSLGYLMDFKERGVFDATYGKVPVTPEQAALHNKVFDKANINGLDGCEVGQSGQFYLSEDGCNINTFLGTNISASVNPKTREFDRNGRRYKHSKPDGEGTVVFVTRVA